MAANVMPDSGRRHAARAGRAASRASSTTIQGGALRTYRFDHYVESVQVRLETQGRPLEAKIELLQGPNNVKKFIELQIEDGHTRPFECVIETPGSGNVVSVENTAPMEFPMTASVVPLSVAGDRSFGGGADPYDPYIDPEGYGRGGRGYDPYGPQGYDGRASHGPRGRYDGPPRFDDGNRYGPTVY